MATLADNMRKSPDGVDASVTVMWALRALERIAGHARNIAEHVIYMVEGLNVRHAKLESVLNQLRGGQAAPTDPGSVK